MLGKIEGRRGSQRMRWLDSITDGMNMNLGKLREMVRDREAWHAAVHGHGVTKSLSLYIYVYKLAEEAMASHSSTLTWRIPGMGEPGGLPSLGSHRVGHH